MNTNHSDQLTVYYNELLNAHTICHHNPYCMDRGATDQLVTTVSTTRSAQTSSQMGAYTGGIHGSVVFYAVAK